MDPTPAPLITQAPADLAGWVRQFDPAALPVLGDTGAAIEDWRSHEDAVDAHLLAEVIGRDPLMMLKLLAHTAQVSRRRSIDDERGNAETVTAALVLLGIGPFFRAFGPQPAAEDWLAGHAGAADGFGAVLARSHRAAAFAIGFAAHRMDPDAAVIHEAALLHDFAELLLWLRAPALAATVAERLQADPTLRSAQAQQAMLNVRLPELQHALMLQWRLPALLVRITDDTHAGDPKVRNVLLAIRLARHTARGWDNAAVPDDLAEIGELLQLGPAPTLRLLQDIDGSG